MSLPYHRLSLVPECRKKALANALIVNAPKGAKRIRRLKEKYFDLVWNAKDMHEAVYLVACLIDELVKLTKLISNNVSCGITFKLSESEAVFLKVSENAKAIKKLYKGKQDLSEIMMVCGNLVKEAELNG